MCSICRSSRFQNSFHVLVLDHRCFSWKRHSSSFFGLCIPLEPSYLYLKVLPASIHPAGKRIIQLWRGREKWKTHSFWGTSILLLGIIHMSHMNIYELCGIHITCIIFHWIKHLKKRSPDLDLCRIGLLCSFFLQHWEARLSEQWWAASSEGIWERPWLWQVQVDSCKFASSNSSMSNNMLHHTNLMI